MRKSQRAIIAAKSDDQLCNDIAMYQKMHDSIPRMMVSTKRSSNARLQANIDEHQKRLLEVIK